MLTASLPDQFPVAVVQEEGALQLAPRRRVARIAHGVEAGRAPAFSALVTTATQIAIVLGVAVLGSLYPAEAGAHAPSASASAHALALVCSAVAANSLVALAAAWRVASSG